MEKAEMGRVLVTAKIQNAGDLWELEKQQLELEKVRTVEIADALVDTGATMLSMPKRLIDALGLKRLRSRRAHTSAGVVETNVFGTVRLTVQGRDCPLDVAELPDHCPVLIGQVPLELLDFVVDPIHQRLIGNPEHGGEHMIEMF